MNLLFSIGKIITFVLLTIVVIILIGKLISDFPTINDVLLVYCLLLFGVMLLIIIPEIMEIKFLGFGITKNDIDHPKIKVKSEDIESDAIK